MIKSQIKATNIDLSTEITNYLEKRLRSVEKFIDKNDPTVRADIELGRTTAHHEKGDVYRAEVNLHMKGKSLRAVAETSDIFSAIDDVKDELSQELRQNKTKKERLWRKGATQVKNILKGFYWWRKK